MVLGLFVAGLQVNNLNQVRYIRPGTSFSGSVQLLTPDRCSGIQDEKGKPYLSDCHGVWDCSEKICEYTEMAIDAWTTITLSTDPSGESCIPSSGLGKTHIVGGVLILFSVWIHTILVICALSECSPCLDEKNKFRTVVYLVVTKVIMGVGFLCVIIGTYQESETSTNPNKSALLSSCVNGILSLLVLTLETTWIVKESLREKRERRIFLLENQVKTYS
jgi:hypothetical protein